jgi:hypothetical protein
MCREFSGYGNLIVNAGIKIALSLSLSISLSLLTPALSRSTSQQ